MKQRLMDLYFKEGADLTDIEVLVQAAADCWLDPDAVRARLASDEDVEMISQAAQAAANAGVNGVPTFILGGKYGVSGAQPAEQLASAIRQVAALGKRAGGGVGASFRAAAKREPGIEPEYSCLLPSRKQSGARSLDESAAEYAIPGSPLRARSGMTASLTRPSR